MSLHSTLHLLPLTHQLIVQAKLSEAELLSRPVDARLTLLTPSSLAFAPSLLDSHLDEVTGILHSAAQNHVCPSPLCSLDHHSKSKKLYKD